MLIIPSGKDIMVSANEAEERRLLDRSRKWLEQEERSEGIHVSDLLDPLYAYWQRQASKKEKELLDREVTTFLVGKILHAFIISSMKKEKGLNLASDEGSKHCSDLGIEYSIDYMEDVPTEIKTSRSYYAPKSLKDLEMYLEQELCYMVAEKVRKGKLWILYLNLKDEDNRTSPEYRAYDIVITKKAFDDYRRQIQETTKLLTRALKTKNPSILPLCRTWKCGETMCKHWKKCKPKGRYNVPERKWKK